MAENPQGKVVGTGKGHTISENAGRFMPKSVDQSGMPAHMKGTGGTKPQPKGQSDKHGA